MAHLAHWINRRKIHPLLPGGASDIADAYARHFAEAGSYATITEHYEKHGDWMATGISGLRSSLMVSAPNKSGRNVTLWRLVH